MKIYKLLFVAQFFPNTSSKNNTGGTISNLDMLRALAKKYSVTVLSFDNSAKEVDFIKEPFKVIIRPSPILRATGLIRHWLDFVRNEVSDCIKNQGAPDAVIAATSTLAAFDVCQIPIKKIAVVRAYENFGLRCSWVPIEQRINLCKLAVVRRLQDVRLIRSADAILTNSQFMKKAIEDRFKVSKKGIFVLKQSADVVPFDIPTPVLTVGFVTRGPDKGLSFVLELARRSPDIRYHIFGHSRDLPKTLPENVIWEGWASDRNLMFSSVALWVVPSLWAEPFGRVSIEAQGADRPVLVADTGGLPETAFDPRFKIEGFDAEQWLKRMRELMSIPVEELKKNGSRVRAAFSSREHDVLIFNAMISILDKEGKEAENA